MLVKIRRVTVNGITLLGLDRPEVVHGLAYDVEHAAQCAFADRNGDRAARVNGPHPAHHAVGGQHGDGTDAAFAEVLLHFANHIYRCRHVKAFACHTQCLINRRQVFFVKLHVNHWADDLHHTSRRLSVSRSIYIRRNHTLLAQLLFSEASNKVKKLKETKAKQNNTSIVREAKRG